MLAKRWEWVEEHSKDVPIARWWGAYLMLFLVPLLLGLAVFFRRCCWWCPHFSLLLLLLLLLITFSRTCPPDYTWIFYQYYFLACKTLKTTSRRRRQRNEGKNECTSKWTSGEIRRCIFVLLTNTYCQKHNKNGTVGWCSLSSLSCSSCCYYHFVMGHI